MYQCKYIKCNIRLSMQDKQFCKSKLNNLDFIFSKQEFYNARVKLL